MAQLIDFPWLSKSILGGSINGDAVAQEIESPWLSELGGRGSTMMFSNMFAHETRTALAGQIPDV